MIIDLAESLIKRHNQINDFSLPRYKWRHSRFLSAWLDMKDIIERSSIYDDWSLSVETI